MNQSAVEWYIMLNYEAYQQEIEENDSGVSIFVVFLFCFLHQK